MFRHLDKRKERGWVKRVCDLPADFHVRTCTVRMTPQKIFNMAAIGGTVAQDHSGGFSFENCKR